MVEMEGKEIREWLSRSLVVTPIVSSNEVDISKLLYGAGFSVSLITVF